MPANDHTSLLDGHQTPDGRTPRVQVSRLPEKPSANDYFKAAILAPRRPAVGPSSLRRPHNEAAMTRANRRVSNLRSVASEETFRWIKGDMIGKGSYGRVYLAFNATSGEIMAVKQVDLPVTRSDRAKKSLKDFVDALRSERQTLRQLDHENIVQYLGFEENTETVNVFLEYVSGGTVGGCYRKCGRLREEVTKNFTSQILRGLAYLHSMGIIHRDMKADNILVQETGVCKISDFGISKQLEAVDRTHSGMKGTSYWMAPEIVTPGSDGYDSKVDVWSLGCVVLEMWTARRPWFDELNIFALIFKLKEPGTAPPLPDDLVLSRIAEHFRRECFQYDQSKRPTAAELLGHPYLELDDDWVFPGLQHLGEPATTTTESSEAPSQNTGTHSTGSTVRPKTIQPGPLALPESREHHSSYFPPRAESPPLVTIAPPPPRQSTTQDTTNAVDWMRSRSPSVTGSESSTSQKSSQHSAGSRSRKLVIHNPDHAPDSTTGKGKEKESPPKPFVYKPPPLPPVNGSVPYSNLLAPLPATRFGSTPNLNANLQPRNSPGRQLSTSPSALQAPARHHKAGPADMRAIMMSNRSPSGYDTIHSSSDGDSIKTSSTWQVPPKPYLPLSPTKSRKLGNHRMSSIAANSRPNSHQVLAHLHEYFPNHNLDEEVETPIEPEFQPNRTGSVARHRVLKSIKTIAAEKISKDMASPVRRRQTRLWDRPTEEIKPS